MSNINKSVQKLKEIIDDVKIDVEQIIKERDYFKKQCFLLQLKVKRLEKELENEK